MSGFCLFLRVPLNVNCPHVRCSELFRKAGGALFVVKRFQNTQATIFPAYLSKK